ncbi:sensor histidine kinase, partial [Nocardia sp. NPDC003482]
AALAAARDAAAAQVRETKTSDARRTAAMAAFANAAGRMQAMMTSMLAELREMEHRHADPTVLADLLQLDHRTAQAGRLADSIAVLSGARSGRRWAKPIAMESILRGAMGRVAGYQRVRLRAVAEIAIAGHAAEGVMHALAELLDNACNFSPPTTEVHVYAAEVPAGVVVTIEDSGLVMSESALARAERTVSGIASNGQRGGSALDLSSLTGTRLGLAVVGHLAHKHGMTVSYRPSAIGGTAVVVVVPRDLIVRLDRAPGSTATLTLPAAPARQQPAPPPITVPAEPVAEIALPKRRRGSTLAAVHPEGLSAPRPSTPPAPAPVRPSAMGAFQRAVSGRAEHAEPVVLEENS